MQFTKFKKIKWLAAAGFIAATVLLSRDQALTVDATRYWMKIKAEDVFKRSLIANTGASIEAVVEDHIYVIANLEEKNKIEKMAAVEVSFPMIEGMDFPQEDAKYHNYQELTDELNNLIQQSPSITALKSIGKSHQNRDIWALRISENLDQSSQKPAVIFLGGHHAREHLSVEMPLRLAQHLLSEYRNGNPQIVNLIRTREIHIIPAVNPDGLEYDIENGTYKYWRKNMRPMSRNMGVDLNRNYGFKWGTGGSSDNPNSDVYKGPQPFSEPETQAIKNYVNSNSNISILLSFHTFSQLILYPWGHKYDSITDANDLAVHKTMAETMAKFNGYTPQQSSDLYIASGDTTDWSYGERRIISFTFELDPQGGFNPRGFYPGDEIIDSVVQKNIPAALYLLEYADNPYRSLSQSVYGHQAQF